MSQRISGRCNHLAARFAGNASRLLGFDALEYRFADLLKMVTADQYWSGMITNIPRTDEVPRGARELSSFAEIDRNHPFFTEDYITTRITRSDTHLLPCLDGDYETAFSLATSELDKEEIALTQAVLGDTDLAMDSTSRISEQHRRDAVSFVVTIELYRHDQFAKAASIHHRLPDGIMSEWGAAQMALGVSNRVPWVGYPYPDY